MCQLCVTPCTAVTSPTCLILFIVDIMIITSEAAEFGLGGGGAFVFGFAWVEAVGDVDGDASAIVALVFGYLDAVGVHGPVVVGGVEDVGS